MTIVVNTHSFNTDYFIAAPNYFVDCIISFAKENNQNNFIFLVSKEKSSHYCNLSKNCSMHLISFPKNIVALNFWVELTLPNFLKKTKATFYFNQDGLCVKNANIKQYSFFDFLPKHLPKTFFFKSVNRKIEKYLTFATKAFTTTSTLKKEIAILYKIDNDKIEIATPTAQQGFNTLFWEKQNEIREDLSNSKDYFFAEANFPSEQAFVQLLKAFTMFKNWQKSSLQLIIHVPLNTLFKQLEQNLATYKFKADVKLVTSLSLANYQNYISCAYAFVYPYFISSFPNAIVNTINCQIPVICQKNNNIENILKDGVEYANVSDIKELANKLILLYKDEKHKVNLIQQAYGLFNHQNNNSLIQKLNQIL